MKQLKQIETYSTANNLRPYYAFLSSSGPLEKWRWPIFALLILGTGLIIAIIGVAREFPDSFSYSPAYDIDKGVKWAVAQPEMHGSRAHMIYLVST